MVHSSELPAGNGTPDHQLAQLADAGNCVVVTKDRDFEISHLLRSSPSRLLLVTTGNISNNALRDLFVVNLEAIHDALQASRYVEMSAVAVIIHGSNRSG